MTTGERMDICPYCDGDGDWRCYCGGDGVMSWREVEQRAHWDDQESTDAEHPIDPPETLRRAS